MVYYSTYGDVQNTISEYYSRSGRKLQFAEAVRRLYKDGQLSPDKLPSEDPEDFLVMSDREFDKFADNLPVPLFHAENMTTSGEVLEDDVIPRDKDVFCLRHPRMTRVELHRHNFFEVNYIVSGKANFIFGHETLQMSAGELCIVGPNSLHDLQIEDESSIVFCICIRSSTFNSSFYPLLSGNDLLAVFFRNILQGKGHDNYLLFYAPQSNTMKLLLRQLALECLIPDSYSNMCCISLVNLILSHALRNYSQTISYYDYKMGTDFSLVLQYIRYNYRTLTLSSLAELFHYSEPYLSTQIRQKTGMTFTALIKRMRLNEAKNYLLHSDMKINEIAETVGYNSADHFSRVFRKEYDMSPADYRKANASKNE